MDIKTLTVVMYIDHAKATDALVVDLAKSVEEAASNYIHVLKEDEKGIKISKFLVGVAHSNLSRENTMFWHKV